MKILFLHGWQSTPGGVKPTYLKNHGHTVLNPALPDDDFDAAVRIAQAEYDQGRADIVVGSSRGGPPYFGPGLLPHAQKLWIDALAVGTKRIGLLQSPR